MTRIYQQNSLRTMYGTVLVVILIGLALCTGSGCAESLPSEAPPSEESRLEASDITLDDSSNQGVTFDIGYFGFGSGWSTTELNPETLEPDPTFPWYCGYTYTLNMRYSGENVASVEYALSGDGVYLEAMEISTDPMAQNAPVRIDSYTVDYDKQDSDREKFQRNIQLSFPIQGEIADLYDQMQNDWENSELRDQLDLALAREAASILEQATFTTTITYADGSQEVRNYHFVMRDDYAEQSKIAYDLIMQGQEPTVQLFDLVAM